MRRLLAVPVALVLAAPTLSAGPATAVTAPTGPPPVQQLAAFQARGAVHLHWTNPAGIDGVVVRFARGRTAPAGPATGTAVAATKAGATLTGLARGTAYAVSVWTQKAGALSRRATTSFSTTQSAAPLTGTVTGIVTDTAGHPLRGAVVDGGFFSEEQRTTSDAQGRFVLHVAPGRQWISAGGRNARGGESDRTGYTGDLAKMTVVAHTVRRGVHFVLHDAGELRGVATDARGVPLAGVAVTYIWPTPYVDPDFTAIAYAYDGLPVAHTGPRGRYTLKGAPADAVVVCFDPSRVAGRNHARAGYAQRCSDRSVAVAPGQVRTLPAEAIPPARGGMLLGTVTGSGGHPLAHASVEVERYRNPFNRDSAHTDRAGTFAVTNLAAGHYRVCVSKSAHGLGYLARCAPAVVRTGGRTRMNTVLAHGGAVSGRALTPSGHAAAGLTVTAESTTQGGYAYGTTDARGGYTLGGLAGGDYKVCFSSDYAPAPAGSTGVAGGCLRSVLTAGRDRLAPDRLLPLGGAVTGTITDTDGKPVPDASINLDGRRRYGYGQSGSDGTYTITGLDPGSYRACVYSFGSTLSMRHRCLSERVTVTRGQTVRHVDVRFPRPTAIRVTVVDSSGHPLSGVELAAVRKCPDYGCRRMPVFGSRVSVVDDSMTGPGGRVDFLGLPRGRYAVCALAYYAAAPTGSSPTGYADKCTGPTFTLDASPGVVSTATIHLDPGGVLTGRVTDGQGHGVPLAAIHFPGTPVDDVPGGVDDFNNATFLQPSPFDDNYTDLHGRYTIRSIRAGQGTLCAHARRYVKGCLSNPLTITPGANTQAPPLALTPRAQAAAEGLPRTRTTSGVPTRRVIVFDGRMVPAGRSPKIRVPSRR